jgi:hypothetical protein
MATISFEDALITLIRDISLIVPGPVECYGAVLSHLLTRFVQIAGPMPPERRLFPPRALGQLAAIIAAHGCDSVVAEACCSAIDALLKGEQGRQLVPQHQPLLR